MDNRDKHLQRHMRRRLQLAQALPTETQSRWARKCIALAAKQHRTAFYLMASLWLAQVSPA